MHSYARYWIAIACVAVFVAGVIILSHPPHSPAPSIGSTAMGIVPLAKLAQEGAFASSLGHPYLASDQVFAAWTSASPESAGGITGADSGTFQCLYDSSDTVILCKDASHVYLYGGETLPVDPSTLSMLAVLGNSEEGGQEYLLKDKDHVYLLWDDAADGQPIASFKILPADPHTVAYLGDWLFKDKDHVFNADGSIDNKVDATSFVSLGGFWFKDKNAVYCAGLNIVSQADPSTFRIINNFFGADTKHVYVADPFSYLDNGPTCGILAGVKPNEMIGVDAVYA